MIDEKQESYWLNSVQFACGMWCFFVFYHHVKRGKFLVKRRRLKKNRRYIRLSRIYRNRMSSYDGFRFVFACFDLASLKLWRNVGVDLKFIPKRFKRRSLPWRLIRR